MQDNLFDCLAGIPQIAAGIKVGRLLGKVAADFGRHGQTKVGVHVDFANGVGRSLAQHFLRNADGVGHLAAEAIDHLNVFGRNRGRAVQHDGEAGQAAGDFVENVKPELGLLTGLELVSAVAGADGDGQRIHAGALHKILHLSRDWYKRRLRR